MLAIGNVIIGRREEAQKPGGTVGLDETRGEAEGLMGETGEREREGDADLVELDDNVDGGGRREEHGRLKKGQEVDDPI